MKKLPLPIIICIIAFVRLLAQQSELYLTLTDGGFYKSSNISLAWSFGEVLTKIYSNESLIITQGFQQPNDPKIGNKIKANADSKISIYPNPASHEFNIKIPNIKNSNKWSELQIATYDVNSKLIAVKKLNNVINTITIQNYSSGIYFIKLTDKNINSYKTFILKIIKN